MAKRRRRRAGSARADEIQRLVTGSLESAIQFFEANLESDMVEATRYYQGDKFGDEEEGRSQVVSRDVHDVVQGQLPSLLQIFLGGEDAIEFAPDGPDDVAETRQMTEYIKYVIREDNEGFLEYNAAFQDGLIRRIGIVKWFHEDLQRVKASVHEALPEIAQLAIIKDPSVVDVDVLSTEEDPETGEALATIRVYRKETEGRERFEAVPPEEFVFTEDARTVQSAPLVAHVRDMPMDQLIEMGIPKSEVEEAAAQQSERMRTGGMREQRLWHQGALNERTREDEDGSQRLVPFAEAYMLVDADGDDVAEVRMFQCIGPRHKIVNGDGFGEVVDEIPFAVLSPYPEGHTVIGGSSADQTMDIQRIKSQVLRGTLNSLAAAIENKIAAQDGMVNMEDLVNPEIVGLIRTLGDPNQVLRNFDHTFVGMHTLPVLQYMDEVREGRTGWDRGAAALEPKDLQSSTLSGVTAALSASQRQLEMIAIAFAETGIKHLYRGLLGLAIRHQKKPRRIQIGGRWVEVDPRHWDANKRIQVNLTVGRGTREERLAQLSAAYQSQLALMQAGCPFVTWVEIRYTLAQMSALAGRRDGDLMFRPWGAQDEQQLQEMRKQNPPPPDPTTLLAQIEQQKVQVEAQRAGFDAELNSQKLQLEHLKAMLQDDRERDRIAREAVLKERELELKHQREIDDAQLQAQVARERAALDADVKRENAAASEGSGE